MVSECHSGRASTTLPHEDCPCGLYAAKSLDEALRHRGSHGSPFLVAGEVSLWGRLIEGPSTWRAQLAYPRSLIFLDKPWLGAGARAAIEESLGAYRVPWCIEALSSVARRIR